MTVRVLLTNSPFVKIPRQMSISQGPGCWKTPHPSFCYDKNPHPVWAGSSLLSASASDWQEAQAPASAKTLCFCIWIWPPWWSLGGSHDPGFGHNTDDDSQILHINSIQLIEAGSQIIVFSGILSHNLYPVSCAQHSQHLISLPAYLWDELPWCLSSRRFRVWANTKECHTLWMIIAGQHLYQNKTSRPQNGPHNWDFLFNVFASNL